MSNRSDRPALVIADAVRVFGGAERFVIDAARGLQRRGWPVVVLAYPQTPLHVRARAAGLPVHTARTRANGAPWTVWPLAAWMRRQHIGALLSVYEKDLRTAALAARLAARSIAVVHSRECDEPIKDRPWIRWFTTMVADEMIVNSEATLTTTLRSGTWLDPERLTVLPKGVDLEHFARALSSPPGLRDDGTIVLGCVGQLVARKRVDALLRAVSRLEAPWILRIAGEGPELPHLQRQCAELGIATRVHFDGFVEELPGWLASIDALVLASWVEGWGYVLAEAAAAGRAVVAYAASSVPEVTPQSAGALLADPGSEDALRTRLAELAHEGAEGWHRRGLALREHAERHLGLDRMIDDLDAVLLRAIARRRKR